jgi:ribonuclease D
LKLALKVICEKEGIAPKLVASSSDIDAVAESDAADVHMMHGWRRELFGDLALAIKRGEAVIGFEDGRVRVLPANRDVKAAAE